MTETASNRRRVSSVAASQFKPQCTEVLKCWDCVNGGELSARQVRDARLLEGGVLERDESAALNQRLADASQMVVTFKRSGVYRSRLVLQEHSVDQKLMAS